MTESNYESCDSLRDKVLFSSRSYGDEVPLVCLTITADTLEGGVAQYLEEKEFVDILELRADLLDEKNRKKSAMFPSMVDIPVILTFRRKCDGGAFEGEEEERKRFFLNTLIAPTEKSFSFVDFEEDFCDVELKSLATEKKITIIRSSHDFTPRSFDVAGKICGLPKTEGEIAKLAFTPQTKADVTKLLELPKSLPNMRYIVCAMGRTGFPSRVFAAKTGSFLTFTSVSSLSSIGHVSPRELVCKYHFYKIKKNDSRLVAVSLGSNIAPRKEYLTKALDALCAMPHTYLFASSNIIETDPVDVPEAYSGMNFLNQAVLLMTSLHPRDFSVKMHRIEEELGRKRTVRNGPRTIDIDLINFEGYVSSDPNLTVPHPRAAERSFVIEPLKEIGYYF